MSILVISLLAYLLHINYGFHPDVNFIHHPPVAKSTEELKTKVLNTKRNHDMVVKKLENMAEVVNKSISELKVAKAQHMKKVTNLAKKVSKSASDLKEIRSLAQSVSSDLTTLNTSIHAAKPKKKEKPKRKACPESKHYESLNENLCVRLSVESDRRSWQNSQYACQDEGGDLVTFMDEREQKLMEKYVSKHMGLSWIGSRIWVGMKKTGGAFKWVSKSNFAGKWSYNHPFNISSLKCVNFSSGGLKDYLCGVLKRYICQIK